ncbi:glycosyltransferase [Gaoshiqia sp. Z1-71]|uniref:glycosyltransferase n=1 Tax=Gaoshiqia hydrogeniformans TaxID=3290090 RepID=UPI003BF7BF86
MKKVLIISYYWPPSGGGGVQRWLKFSKYLPEFGWKPYVAVPENPEYPVSDETLSREIHPDIVEIKIPIWEPYHLFRLFTGKKKDEKVNSGFLKNSEKRSLTERISLWLRGNLLIPDPRVFWVGPAFRRLKREISVIKPDWIITTGPPHSVHLIGLKLHRQFGIKWMADFRDPWSTIDYLDWFKPTRLARNLQARLERKVLKTADVTITVSKNWAAELRKLGAKNVAVITNGFDETDFKETSVPKPDQFILTHTGLISSFRNPSSLWTVLDRLCETNPGFASKFELRLIGNVGPEVIDEINQKTELKKHTRFKGYLSHQEVLQEYAESSVLLLLLNQSDNGAGHIPGKFFEYLAAQKPILALGDTEGDVAGILKETGNGQIVDPQHVSDAGSYILSLFNNEITLEPCRPKTYSRKSLTGVLAGILN